MTNQTRFDPAACSAVKPGLAVRLPDEVSGIARQNDAVAHLKAARSQYQQGLLQWLRGHEPPAALRLMQQAVSMAMRCAPQDDSRAIWWVASGLLDCLGLDALPPESNAGKLLSRLDQQMRAAAEGIAADAQPVLDEMLCLIARSAAASERVEQIKQVYALGRYLPEPPALPPDESALRLSAMREQLRDAEESWELCAQGDAAAGQRFVEHAGHLLLHSEKLERDGLQYLARQIHVRAQLVGQPEYVRAIAMDMAMALLLLDKGIEHYGHLSGGFQEQARILSERMQRAADRQPEDARRLAELVELYCRMDQHDVQIALANEMLVNLQLVEEGLNAFFADASRRNELAGQEHLLAQIHGGLRILSLDQAEQLLLSFRGSVRYFAQSEDTPDPLDWDALSAELNALKDYLQRLAQGQQGDTAALLAALAEPSMLRQLPVQPENTPAVQHAAPLPQGEEQELLEVFLEEAEEVLDNLRANLGLAQMQPDSHEPIATLRRGFHTLKGSGRMVGLTDLGEVAWAVERALNKWLQHGKPASPGVLRFVDQAVQAFASWVETLNRHSSVHIEAGDLVATAQRIEQGLEPEGAEQAEPAEEPAPVMAETAAAPEFFNIACEEAKQLLLVLHRQCAALRTTRPPLVQYEFTCAAHKLAGVARSLGFASAVELASALEAWLDARMDNLFTLNETQAKMLDRSVAALDAMVQGICDKQVPQAQSDLAEQLWADKDSLYEESAPRRGASTPENAIPSAAPLPHSTPSTASAEARKAAAQAEPESLGVEDDVDAQLLPVFLEEADDLCPKIGAALRAWRERTDDERQLQLLKRLLHTLKGSARMAGAMRIGEITHEMEDHVFADAPMRAQAGFWDALENGSDRIGELLEELRSGNAGAAETGQADAGHRAEEQAGGGRDHHAPGIAAAHAFPNNMLRVRADVVDRMVNEASEISVAHSRMETEMHAFKEGLMELAGSVARLRKQLRELEIQAESRMPAHDSLAGEGAARFDPLEFDRFTRLQELTRFLNESVHDVQTVQQSLLKNADETAAAMAIQTRLNRELQQSLMHVRMMPFASIGERLYRIVRQTGKELNKRANLELLGAGVELDRSVLERMTAPFEHLLRNAIVHGLESDRVRAQRGKNPIGEISLSLHQENNEVVFEFGDDGGGLDYALLRDKAIAKGLLQSDAAVSDAQLAQLIFTSGISTATEVTEVAGRGVGMDVVCSEIAALGGRIDVNSKSGQGTQFVIRLPLTLAITQILMVRSGAATYAIPSTMVEQVRQVTSAELASMYAARETDWQGKSYPLHYLPHLLGESGRAPENQPHNPVLLLRSGEQRIALHVDGLLGNHEAVVKNVGPQLARLPGIAGATVQGDGEVVLILNPAQLAQRIATTGHEAARVVPEAPPARPLVMVVDDSLTVRKITTRLLTRAGYEVVVAKDGLDALERLRASHPAVMLLDIEMPRMDGFELIRHLRRDAQTKDLPIIMITSRSADKHREYAMQLGANAYLGKPYRDDELLRQIAGFAAVAEIG